MQFLLNQMTFLRYFLPLTIEGNKRGIKSIYYYKNKQKYNNPVLYLPTLRDYAELYDFELKNIDEHTPEPGVVFMVEGVDIEYLNDTHKKMVITYMTDFNVRYDTYIDKVDHVFFPSKQYAGKYKSNDKNVYLGSPKYDVELNKREIIREYHIMGKMKYALVLFPKRRDKNKIDILRIYDYLHNMGYTVLVKTRGKDLIEDINLRGDQYFVDTKWFPHTSMELIHCSEVVINFDSTSIKECVMLDTPMINFHVKPFKKPLEELYSYSFVKDLPVDVEYDEFEYELNKLFSEDRSKYFELCRKRYLFENKNVCKNILDYLGL